MKIHVVGGGPGGLYSAILFKLADPSRDVTVFERNRIDDTFGFGVVFSDATMDNLREADEPSWRAITDRFTHWDDIDIHYRGRVLRSTGHGFAGLSRLGLLSILAERAREVGVDVRFETDVHALDAHREADLVIAADGINSRIRDDRREHFETTIDLRPNRFVWLGTTRPFPAFTFYFKEDEHGLWRGHAYQYENGLSTFIVEATGQTFDRAGLDPDDESAAVSFCEALFAEELDGHRLVGNRSIWRRFPTVRNGRWSHENVVLVGDAAHTAHFSVGSGTKLALEDAIALREAFGALGGGRGVPGDRRTMQDGVRKALDAYEAERRPPVESLQRAAQASLVWFEEVERYHDLEPVQFGFTLLTRSLRITHEDLRARDPGYVREVDAWFHAQADAASGRPTPLSPAGAPPPPCMTAFRLRDLRLENRVVVSAMCQYSAREGLPNDWHLVHLGSRAIGGAGLVMTEMTDVSAEGRISPGCTGLYEGAHVPAWRRIVDFVHAHTDAKIGVQLSHAGRKGATRVPWEGADEPLPEGDWPLVAPSPIPWFSYSQVPRQMTRADMDAVRDDFVRATHLAGEAGFDLVELHFAHGYLLASFISPLTNRRTDDYGGPLSNRMRYPLEVLDAVREVWPAHKPISVRISATDWYPGGMEADDAVNVARMLAMHGCDLTDVSAGQTVPDQRPVYGRLFQTPFSDRIRHEVGIPTMAVGNISSFTDVNTILAAGRADLCALARMHLWNPYWTRHAAYELGYPMPWPAPYASIDRFTPRFK